MCDSTCFQRSRIFVWALDVDKMMGTEDLGRVGFWVHVGVGSGMAVHEGHMLHFGLVAFGGNAGLVLPEVLKGRGSENCRCVTNER